jgi:hypothetical protein
MKKRYVCSLCHGKGSIESLEENADYNPNTIYSEEFNVATQNEFKTVIIPCPTCVEKGWQPFVEIER